MRIIIIIGSVSLLLLSGFTDLCNYTQALKDITHAIKLNFCIIYALGQEVLSQHPGIINLFSFMLSCFGRSLTI